MRAIAGTAFVLLVLTGGFAPARGEDPPGVAEDLRTLREGEPAARLAALGRLGESESPAAFAGLVRAWADAEPAWRGRIERAARGFAGRGEAGPVLDVLAAAPPESEGLVSVLLGVVLDEGRADVVRARLAGADAAALAPALAASGRFEAPDLLLEALGATTEPGARFSLIRSLGRLKGFAHRVVPTMRKMRALAPADEVRALLAAAYALPGKRTAEWLAEEALGDGLEIVADGFTPAERPDVLLALTVHLPKSLDALRRLTGKKFGVDPETWRQWIERAGRAGADETTGKRPPPAPEVETFYGVPLPEGDFVFVLDASASMRRPVDDTEDAPPLVDAVKEHVLEVLGKLPETRRFNVIFFNDRAWTFRSRMVEATSANLGFARKYVEKVQAIGHTNLEAALREALDDPDVRDIVFLSDGAPTGRVRTVDAVMKLLDDRKVRIHTVARASDRRWDRNRDFMKELAERTGGRHGTF